MKTFFLLCMSLTLVSFTGLNVKEKNKYENHDVIEYLQRVCDSATLAANLIDSGESRPADTAAHHIVGAGSRASTARDILTKHKIDIDDAVNGVFLPNSTSSSAPGHIHTGRHLNSYIDAVNTDIAAADKKGGKSAVIAQLKIIKRDLLNKSYTALQN